MEESSLRNMFRQFKTSSEIGTLKLVTLDIPWEHGVTFFSLFCYFMFNLRLESKISEVVLRLLEDDWLEVREKASQVLGGLLHCDFIGATSKLIENFKMKSQTKLKRKEVKNHVMESVCVQKLKERHSGILGLCAFINAYPYDVPEFIPDVFLILGDHLNDPQPIPSTIRKTLGDFKRTHHDNWEQHSLKFTEEQLAVLGDLTIPPSYYA